MAESISILGSTGSIGKQTLDVIRNLGNVQVKGLSTNTSIELVEEQIREFKPEKVCVYNQKSASDLKVKIADTGTEIVTGTEGLVEIATMSNIDTVVTSVVGTIGLVPTVEAIKEKKNIALANKETLVAAGKFVTELAKENNVSILPIDSEHSAILQCMQGVRLKEEISKIILTASGGPFRGKTKAELKNIKVENALNHPNWSMGKKITIDSATLMNKGLELIEAYWLFQVELKNIEIVVHPQSIIHSMVELIDGSVIAQMGMPDMKVPIQYALTYPYRKPSNFSKLKLTECKSLTFEKPDIDTFDCLRLAYTAITQGGTMPAVMNASNESAVNMFLEQKIGFLDIPGIIEQVMRKHKIINNPTLGQILEADIWARNTANEIGGI